MCLGHYNVSKKKLNPFKLKLAIAYCSNSCTHWKLIITSYNSQLYKVPGIVKLLQYPNPERVKFFFHTVYKPTLQRYSSHNATRHIQRKRLFFFNSLHEFTLVPIIETTKSMYPYSFVVAVTVYFCK